MGIREELRHTAAKIVNAGKFSVASAANQVGLQAYDIVRGASKGDVKRNIVMVEEMKWEEDMNNRQQQSRSGDEDDNLKRLFDEPLNYAKPPTKKFIRSRL